MGDKTGWYKTRDGEAVHVYGHNITDEKLREIEEVIAELKRLESLNTSPADTASSRDDDSDKVNS